VGRVLPELGVLRAIRRIADLSALVTLTRARSASEAARRSRPPSPTAAASCSVMASISRLAGGTLVSPQPWASSSSSVSSAIRC
jgi:hypothetical protein